MKSIIFLALIATMLTNVKSQTLEQRFTEWVKRFQIRVDNEDHRMSMLKNWIQNDKYIDEVKNSISMLEPKKKDETEVVLEDDKNNFIKKIKCC